MSRNRMAVQASTSPYKGKSLALTSESAINHSLQVLENVKKLGNEGIPGFEWPSAANEQRRIREASSALRGKTLAESFAAAYGVREVFGSKENVDRLQAITCKELKPGDVVELRILAIDKKGVTFEQDAESPPVPQLQTFPPQRPRQG